MNFFKKSVFDSREWDRKIANPDWYMEVPNVVKALSKLHDSNFQEYERVRNEIYTYFEDRLRTNKIVLGDSGKDFDSERKPLDTIVIHHTSIEPGISTDLLSILGLIRLYAPQYAKPAYEADADIKGKAIWSGHFMNGRQVFYGYHWIVRMDGTFERLLGDKEIGWHAGNWDVNCRSVGIVLDNDYENSSPSPTVLSALARLIQSNYPIIRPDKIIGHCESNLKTICPSKLFLDHSGVTGWKHELIKALQ